MSARETNLSDQPFAVRAHWPLLAAAGSYLSLQILIVLSDRWFSPTAPGSTFLVTAMSLLALLLPGALVAVRKTSPLTGSLIVVGACMVIDWVLAAWLLGAMPLRWLAQQLLANLPAYALIPVVAAGVHALNHHRRTEADSRQENQTAV